MLYSVNLPDVTLGKDAQANLGKYLPDILNVVNKFNRDIKSISIIILRSNDPEEYICSALHIETDYCEYGDEDGCGSQMVDLPCQYVHELVLKLDKAWNNCSGDSSLDNDN